jgi:hypothetical protein
MANSKDTEHSSKYEYCKEQYKKGYMTDSTLRKWVLVGLEKPGQGITAAEYEEIAGEQY